MAELHESTLVPVFIRKYPPFALALGMSFLSWLTGSLAFDSLWSKDREVVLGIFFGLIFLGAVLTALYSWTDVLNLHRLGLYFNEFGVTEIQAALLRTKTRTLSWEQVTGIKLTEKGYLVFETAVEPLQVPTAGLLENPEWIRDRARAWAEAVKNNSREDKTISPLTQLQAQLEGIKCQSCGGSVDFPLGNAEHVVCSFCGNTQGLPDKIKEVLKRLAAVMVGLPAAHRQFQEKTLRRFVAEAGKYRRRLLGVGWGTAILWVVFALVDLIGAVGKKENKGIDVVDLGVFLGLAVLSLVAAYLLVFFIRRISGRYSLPMRGLAPVVPGGAARCRLCGADLPEEGILRRCSYCQTDSVIMGQQLAEAERRTKKILWDARVAVSQGTESAGRLLDSVAARMQLFAYSQFFWLHIPILVALDGSTGMLIRLSGIFLAMLVGNVASAVLGMRWLSRTGT
jgi:hypothetical protein